jgi:hypothetical protein
MEMEDGRIWDEDPGRVGVSQTNDSSLRNVYHLKDENGVKWRV